MDSEIGILKRQLERERTARKAAESILEKKSIELYHSNLELLEVNKNLERIIKERTAEIQELAKFPMESPYPFFRLNLLGEIIFCNTSAEKLIRYQKSENENICLDLIKQIIENATPNFETESNDQDSFYSLLCVPFFDEGYINIYGRDITESKRIKQELETNEQRLSVLIKSLKSAILLEDEQGKISLVNQEFCNTFFIKKKPEELIGINYADLILNITARFKNSNDFLKRTNILIDSKISKIDEPFETIDGRNIERDFIPIFQQGKYLGHLWNYRDITFRKNIEENIRRSEEKYRNIIGNMNMGILEVDNNENIISANNTFCKMTKYSIEDLIGKNARTLLLDKEYKNPMEQQIDKRKQGESDVYEIKIRNKFNNPIWVVISGAPLLNDKKEIIGSIGIHLDITDRKKLEEELSIAKEKAEESVKAKELFLANMSHEIRTPMNAIIGMAGLLKKTTLEENQKKYLNGIHTSGINLLNIVNEILDFSKIESGNLSLEKIPFNLHNIANEIKNMFHYKAEEKGIILSTKIDTCIPKHLMGDPFRINQILINLIGNAIKFTEKGSVFIEIKLLHKRNDIADIELKITDTGIGISQNKLDSIFDSFKQSDNSISRKYGGTGLGLSISKKLAEQMGGTITVSSVENKGTSFNVIIPMHEDVNEVYKTQQKTIEVIPNTALLNTKILVVEDHEINRFLATTILENYNAKVTTANNGLEAIQQVKKSNYDIILMDMQMPEMDGIEATLYIRNILNIETPIIALTANALTSELEKCIQVGMNDYITKPFEEKHFIKTILKYRNTEYSTDTILTVKDKEDIAENTPSLYSTKLLESISKNDTTFIHKMMLLFIESTPIHLNEMNLYIEEKNWKKVGALAHKIKPSIDNLGIHPLKEPIRDIEKLCQEELSINVEQIKNVYSKTANHLQIIIEQIKRDFSL